MKNNYFFKVLKMKNNTKLLVGILFLLFSFSTTFAQDIDGDGVNNTLDLDNDNDGILDANECGAPTVSEFKESSVLGLATNELAPLNNPNNGHVLEGATTATLDFHNGKQVTVTSNGTDIGAGRPAHFYHKSKIHNKPDYRGNSLVFPPAHSSNQLPGNKGINSEWKSKNDITVEFLEPTTHFTLVLDDFDFKVKNGNNVIFETIYGLSIVPTSYSSNVHVSGLGLSAVYRSNGMGQILRLHFKLDTPVSTFNFKMGRTGNSYGIGFNVELYDYCDTDGDGVPDYLDTDSDNDGCPDALEGGTNDTSDSVTAGDLVVLDPASGLATSGNTVANLGKASNGQGIPTNTNLPTVGQVVGSSKEAVRINNKGTGPAAIQSKNVGESVTFTSSFELQKASTFLSGVPDFATVNAPALTYQWYFKSSATGSSFVSIASATSNTYSISSVAVADKGKYKVVVTYPGNSCPEESAEAVLDVSVVVIVPVVSIEANNDDFTSNPIVAGTTKVVGNAITNNDIFKGQPAVPSDLNITTLVSSEGITINSDGDIVVPATAVAGTHIVKYQICEKLNPSICSDAEVKVRVVNKKGILPKIIIKKAFSPNGDGINEGFKIKNIEEYESNTVEIFNRWGNTVYKTNNYNNTTNKWSGKSEGDSKVRAVVSSKDLVPTGTYFYLVTVISRGKEEVIKGWVYVSTK